MAGQQAWQRYGRLQGQIMAQAADRVYADRGAEVLAKWAGERDEFGNLGNPNMPQPAAGGDIPPAGPAESSQDSEPPQIGRRFVLAGNAYLTLTGRDRRYTFRVAQGKPREGDAPDRAQPFFLSLLSGPDNTADYTYVGIVDRATGLVRLTRASRITAESQPVRAWNWAMRYLWAGQPLPAPATIHHAGRCGRCGRMLTVPGSIESGFGPECAGKVDA
jgi:hypothetical protein